MTSPVWILLLVGILAALGVAVLATVGVAAFWWIRSQGGAGSGAGVESSIESLGYEPNGSGQWKMRMARTDLLFEHSDGGGWRWIVNLPRYNTLTLRVEERANPSRGSAIGEIFETRNPEFDQRFEVSSPLPAQTLALLMDPKVVGAMLGMPFLSLTLKGDELVIADAQRVGLQRAPRDTGRSAEVEVHRAVVGLVMSIVGTLYARGSGTLLPQHR